jgi:hypothetical protein
MVIAEKARAFGPGNEVFDVGILSARLICVGVG